MWGYARATGWGAASGAAGAFGKFYTARWIGNAFRRPRMWQTYWGANCRAQSSTRLDSVAMIRNRDPESAWYSLSWNERRHVLKYAGKGQMHPDEEIAQIAKNWAEWRLGPRDNKLSRSAAAGAVAALGDAAAGGIIGNLLAERRAAKKIVRSYP